MQVKFTASFPKLSEQTLNILEAQILTYLN